MLAGGEVCSYRLKYRKYNDTLPFEGVAAFTATLVLNATGFYNTLYAYRAIYDGEYGACAEGHVDERGVESFSFTHNNISYSSVDGTILFGGPWFQHFPIGVRYSDLQRNEILEDYFTKFFFISDNFDFNLGCEGMPSNCVCDSALSLYCVDTIVPVSCRDNSIPFVPDTFVVYQASNTLEIYGENAEWFGMSSARVAESAGLYNPVLHSSVDRVAYRKFSGAHVDLTDIMCPGETYCYYFPVTASGGEEADIQVDLYMGPGLGQAQRLKFQMSYWSMPDSRGRVCVYFDYTRVDIHMDEQPFRPTMNRVWCGELAEYETGINTLEIELPLTYGPAYSGISMDRLDSNGVSEFRPIVVEAGAAASFVMYNMSILSMGSGYHCAELGRRRGGEGKGEGEGEKEHTTSKAPTWSNWIPPPKEDYNAYRN